MPKYFHFHTDEITFDAPLITTRCLFIKQNGDQCKISCTIGLPMCRHHLPMAYNVKVKPFEIEGAGNGLFAHDSTKDEDAVIFKKGDLIVPYYGEKITEETLNRRYGKSTAPYAIQLYKGYFEDGALERGVGSLLNHSSRNQNCRFSISRNNSANIIATKNIKNHKELYVSYGRQYRLHERGVESSTNNRMRSV